MFSTTESASIDARSAHQRPRLAVALLCALAGVLAVACAPAQARTVYIPATPGSFGSEGSGPGQFDEPWGIAVSNVTHDVYVVDSRNRRVEEWSSFGSSGSSFLGEFVPPGGFSQPTWIAVDNSGDPLDPSSGDVYVADPGHGVVDKFTATGSYVGSLTGPAPKGVSRLFGVLEGVTVSPSGEVWVLERSGEIFNFSDGLVNEYLGERSTIFGTLEFGLAVDNENDLYVNNPKILKLSSSGQTLINPFCGEVEVVDGSVGPVKPVSGFGVAVDSASGEVFVDNGGSVGVCGLDGEPLDGFSLGPIKFGLSSDVAVDESDGMVYATAKASDEVVVFDAVKLPTVGVGALSGQSPRGVTLNGTVDPEGLPVTSCEFEYVAAGEYEPGASDPYEKGAKVACEPGQPGGAGGGTAVVPVKARVEGLTPETAYDYRLVAENKANRPSATPDQVFSAGPVLGGEFVTDVASESATLNASIDPNGDDTHYYFQYGASTSYGFEVPVAAPGVDLGSVAGAQSIGVHVQQHLAPGTVYHYRVVVLQGGEVFAEPDRTFTTQAVAGGPVLPDGRAWELVSPADKKGALIEQFADGVGDDIQAASDGSGVTYLTGGPAGEDPQGRINWSQTLSERVPGGGGWRSEDLTLPRRLPENEETATASALREEYGSVLLRSVVGRGRTAGCRHAAAVLRSDRKDRVPA